VRDIRYSARTRARLHINGLGRAKNGPLRHQRPERIYFLAAMAPFGGHARVRNPESQVLQRSLKEFFRGTHFVPVVGHSWPMGRLLRYLARYLATFYHRFLFVRRILLSCDVTHIFWTLKFHVSDYVLLLDLVIFRFSCLRRISRKRKLD